MSENTSKPASENKQSSPLGCVFVILLVIAIIIIGPSFFEGGGDFKIVDGDARLREHGSIGYVTPEMVATNMVGHVYNIATKHPEVRKIVVDIYYTKQEVADKYGREPNGDVVIGTLTIDNVAEVRRYESDAFYSAQVHDTFAAEIRQMTRNYILKP